LLLFLRLIFNKHSKINNEALRQELELNATYLFKTDSWGQAKIEDKEKMLRLMFCMTLLMRFRYEQFERIMQREGIVCALVCKYPQPMASAETDKPVECSMASHEMLKKDCDF